MVYIQEKTLSTENNYSQTGSIFDRLPKSEDGSLVRNESLFKGLPRSENETEYASYTYDYNDRTRPTSITVVGVLLTISLVYGLIQVLGLLPDARYLPGWVWLVLLVDYGLMIAAIVGLFTMKKYGAGAFVVQTIVSTVFGFAFGANSTALLNLVGSVIMLVFVFRKYDDME